MQPATQPFVRAQHPLAAYWQAFRTAPHLRLSRWLSTEADRPLLRDYLLGLSAGPQAPLCQVDLPASADWATQLRMQPGTPVLWLEPPASESEDLLRKYLAAQNAGRLLVLEDVTTQPLRRLARWFPTAVHTCTPAVSMQQVLADLFHQPVFTEPTGRFQQQFYHLTVAIAQADSPAVRAHATACLATCKALPGFGTAVTVWLASGHYFLGQKLAEEALSHFAAALACTEASFRGGNAGAGLLSVQAWLGEAQAWQQRRRGQPALTALQRALNRAAQLDASLLGVEAARQLGLAHERAGQPRLAWASYQQGLQVAEQLLPAHRSAAIIQALGEAYISCLRTAPEQQAVRTRLLQLLA